MKKSGGNTYLGLAVALATWYNGHNLMEIKRKLWLFMHCITSKCMNKMESEAVYGKYKNCYRFNL